MPVRPRARFNSESPETALLQRKMMKMSTTKLLRSNVHGGLEEVKATTANLTNSLVLQKT